MDGCFDSVFQPIQNYQNPAMLLADHRGAKLRGYAHEEGRVSEIQLCTRSRYIAQKCS
jgi:hypothetical protein